MALKDSKKRVSFYEIVREYARHSRRYPLLLATLLFAILVTQGVSVITPIFLSRFFNGLVEALQSSSPELEAELYTVLGSIAILYIIMWLARRLFGFTIMPFETAVMRDVYHSTFGYLIRHSHHFFSSQFSGTLTRRVSKYVFAFESLFDSLAMTFIPTFLYLVGAISVLTFQNKTLGLMLGGWALIFFVFQVYISRLRQPLREERSLADSTLAGGVSDAITNQHMVMLFARARHEEAIFGALTEKWRKATVRSWTADEYIWASQGLLMIAIQLALLYGAFYYWQRGLLTIGDFVLIQTYALGIIDNLMNVTRELRRVYDAVADAGEMLVVLKEPHSIADAPGALPIRLQGGKVEFRDTTFTYGEDRSQVLDSISLVVGAGEKIGLVGKSGAGKSTLVKLLLRHYDVTSGTISIDDQDIRSVTQDSLRQAVSFVPQEPLLFHRSIRDNIAYGNPDATEDDIENAARAASAHDFIMRFPNGYETLVGERGVKLSGGERQRVAIARAILKDSPILVLDEATSALDSESEVAIQNALHSLMEGKTVIAIAHRLSTLRAMDRIIVMDGGKIVEDGTHDQLAARGGIYSELWTHQAGGFLKDD